MDRDRGWGIRQGIVWVVLIAVAGCSDGVESPRASSPGSLPGAEAFIDAFYSWDPRALEQTVQAPDDIERVLYYQAWAQAAHYRIQTRRPCALTDTDQVTCRVTVTDDFGKVLGYIATDMFTLGFRDGVIVAVDFEGDDPPIFDELFAWIASNQPHVMRGPCLDLFSGGKTPAECAAAVAAAAREFVR